jgi:Protein of unknown function (DUF3584)
MNYLTKIIFINSASIKYAEINLNGHVHLIGTQGVGKSTILRAILFFYNADLNKLGLTGKQSYPDYYYPYPESYIVYEVARAEGNYCVISYKAQQRVVFQFMDEAYSKDFFIPENGVVPNEWKGIANRLDAKNVFYSEQPIASYTEYKNILYGATLYDKNGKPKNEWKRYALLKSELYQNIPKTIQNVFLNAKLDATFIKQTLIDSLESENPIEHIPLILYRKHFKNFNTELKDFEQFKYGKAPELAEKIRENYNLVRQLEREEMALAKALIWTIEQLDRHEPQLNALLAQLKVDKDKNEQTEKDWQAAHEVKATELNAVIAVQSNLLTTVAKKQKDYDELNIQSIIAKVRRKKEFELESDALNSEHKILIDSSYNITEKYSALLNEVENDWIKYENDKKAQKNDLEAAFLSFHTEQKDSADHLIAEIEASNTTDEIVLSLDSKAKNDYINQLRIEESQIKNKSFFKEEIETAVQEVRKQEDIAKQAAEAIKQATQTVKRLKGDLQKEEKQLQDESDLEQKKVDFSLEKARKSVIEINDSVKNSQNSLYGWLNEHYPNWENTIGKVIQDNTQVLFNAHLLPRFVTNQENLSFYGIELNLHAIQQKIKTVADYESEKTKFEAQIGTGLKHINDLKSTLCTAIKDLNKKFSSEIKKVTAHMTEQEYQKPQAITKANEAKITLQELKKRANSEQAQLLENLEKRFVDAEWQANIAVQALQARKETYQKDKKNVENAKNEKIKIEKEIKTSRIQSINDLMKAKQNDFKTKQKTLKRELEEQLSNAGADMNRLETNRKRFITVQNGLNYIEQNQHWVVLYNQDKTNYLDKAMDFEATKKKAVEDLESSKKQLEADKIFLKKDLDIIKEKITKTKNQLATIQTHKSIIRQFLFSEVYKKLETLFQTPTEAVETTKNCDELTVALQHKYQAWKEQLDEMKKNIRNFSDLFSDDNVFHFKKQLDGVNAFFQFAEFVMAFIDERKIETIENAFNRNFAGILKIIGAEIQGLVTREEALKKIIVQINRDLNKRDFASVIKEIELRISDNDEDLTVCMLKTIRKFNEEQITPLHEQNLFPVSDVTVNKAIELAKKLIERLDKDKREVILLSDCFKLEFRVKENNNETNWITSLTKVGSDGTDVIVKALLNIVLLNVFKEEASNKAKTFQLHCMMDEIGMLHPTNMRGILKFAAERNIFLINGSPIATDAQAYKNIYILEKDSKNFTKVKRLLTTQI